MAAESSNTQNTPPPPPTTTIIEEREEFMVPPTGGCQGTHRVAHFLKPTVPTMEGLPPLELPHLNSSPPEWSVKLNLKGWTSYIKNWKEWVRSMEVKHDFEWREAGIYDAIMASTHRFPIDSELLIAITERWCPETNTFVFPWGEATFTLEDMLVLGGFPVLGHPVSLPLEESEHARAWVPLDSAREQLQYNGKDTYIGWLHCFRHSIDSKFRHEAFLALWLARFVFPSASDDGRISNRVFSIAVHLARGTRLALAQAVLASIYSDLRLLKESMFASTGLDFSELLVAKLWSPLQFVQAWAWERLPTLCPRANVINRIDVRMARWSDSVKNDNGNLRPHIISAGDTFLWRPYTLALDGWSIPSFYMENGVWLVCDDDLGDPFKSFLRCLRAGMLEGVDCVEPYNPHRVCMQFGYDQDLPGWVPREPNVSADVELCNVERLYVPPRLYLGDWSRAYAHWWRNTVLCPLSPSSRAFKKRRRGHGVRRDCTNLSFGCGADVPPEFALRIPGTQKENTTCTDTQRNIPEIPPGFEHKFNATDHVIIQKDVAGSSSSSGVAKVLETPPGFNSKIVDVPLGFDSSPEIGNQNRGSVLKQQKKRATCLAAGNISNGLDEASPSVGVGSIRKPPRVGSVGSLTGAEYRMKSSSQNDVAGSSSTSGVAKVLETPPGFSSKSVDVPPGFNHPLNIGNRKGRSGLKHQKTRTPRLAVGSISNGLAEASPSVVVGSIREPQSVGLIGNLTGAEYRMNSSSQKGSSLTNNGSSNSVAELLDANLLKFEEHIGALKKSVQICEQSSSMEVRAQVPKIKARILAATEKFKAELEKL